MTMPLLDQKLVEPSYIRRGGQRQWADALSLSIKSSALTCWRIILGSASGLECFSPSTQERGPELRLSREERWSLLSSQCPLASRFILGRRRTVAITYQEPTHVKKDCQRERVTYTNRVATAVFSLVVNNAKGDQNLAIEHSSCLP